MRWPAALLCFGVGCVSGPRALTHAQLEAFAARQYDGAFDEVFDATAIALERLGYGLERLDERQGTFEARRPDGRGYAVSVVTRGDAQRVVAVPVPERALWVLDGDEGESARWDALEAQTRALLEQWRDHPEWTYVPARELVGVLGFRARVPKEWERVDPSVSRRVLVVQRYRSRRGLNPSLVFEVARRTARGDPRPFLLSACEVALGARGRLRWPDAAGPPGREGGTAKVLDGTVPRTVRWHLWDQRSAAWSVRVAAVCAPQGEEACDETWAAVAASIVSRDFAPADPR